MVTIEKDGLNSSAIFVMTYIYSEYDLNEWLMLVEADMKDNIIYKNADIEFGLPYKDEYGKFHTHSAKYSCSLMGLEHEGVIHTFHGGNKTFAILIQEAVEDHDKNTNGFIEIEENFQLEGAESFIEVTG